MIVSVPTPARASAAAWKLPSAPQPTIDGVGAAADASWPLVADPAEIGSAASSARVRLRSIDPMVTKLL